MTEILIVEDDEATAFALRESLECWGHSVHVAADGLEAIALTHSLELDVMLPKLSGFDVCRRIREGGSDLPIIMLTARGQEVDTVFGLTIGADDYMSKPFSPRELIARIEALLRRTALKVERVTVVEFGDVCIDFRLCEATKGGHPLALTALEFKLLKYFVDHPRQDISRDQLLRGVWGMRDGRLTRTVDAHIAKLRKKIETHPSKPRHIITSHGSGYRFQG
jgi:DNA-binding response OmpR family regulator